MQDEPRVSSPAGRGQVIANFGRLAAIRTDDDRLIRSHVRRRTGLVVCGDTVDYARSDDGGGYVVEQRLPRHSVLARPDRRGQLKPLAANIDRIGMVIAPRPEPDWTMVNAFLAYARQYRLDPLLIYNKIDIAEENAPAGTIVDIYAASVCAVVKTGCLDGTGITDLHRAFAGAVNVLVGQSGVGKSSIIRALLPDQAVQTRAISELTGLGTHTTTTTMLYQINNGGLIDSPGVRQFDISHLEPAALHYAFPEFDAHRPHCRFADCTHLHEPGCAVKAAVEDSRINEVRWRHYKELLERYTT